MITASTTISAMMVGIGIDAPTLCSVCVESMEGYLSGSGHVLPGLVAFDFMQTG